jgi:hypothetical protein
MTIPPLVTPADIPATITTADIRNIADGNRDAIAALVVNVQALISGVQALTTRVTALEAAGTNNAPTTVVDITAAQETAILAVKLGNNLELRGPTSSTETVRIG